MQAERPHAISLGPRMFSAGQGADLPGNLDPTIIPKAAWVRELQMRVVPRGLSMRGIWRLMAGAVSREPRRTRVSVGEGRQIGNREVLFMGGNGEGYWCW